MYKFESSYAHMKISIGQDSIYLKFILFDSKNIIIYMLRVKYNFLSSFLLYSSWIDLRVEVLTMQIHLASLYEIGVIQDHQLSNYSLFWFLSGGRASLSGYRTKQWRCMWESTYDSYIFHENHADFLNNIQQNWSSKSGFSQFQIQISNLPVHNLLKLIYQKHIQLLIPTISTNPHALSSFIIHNSLISHNRERLEAKAEICCVDLVNCHFCLKPS